MHCLAHVLTLIPYLYLLQSFFYHMSDWPFLKSSVVVVDQKRFIEPLIYVVGVEETR